MGKRELSLFIHRVSHPPPLHSDMERELYINRAVEFHVVDSHMTSFNGITVACSEPLKLALEGM